jgi:hypothetical protein
VTEQAELRRPGTDGRDAGPLEAALDAVNEEFHAAYDTAKSEAKRESPVLVLLADTLVVFRHGVRTELPYTPDAFVLLKSISHAPVALYAELQRGDGPQKLSQDGRQRLERLRKLVLQTRQKLQDPAERVALTDDVARDVRTVLQSSETMLELAEHGTTRDAVEKFANAIGPVLKRLMHEATRLQLQSLHECVERALAVMSAAERADLYVVVTGDHQARSRSLGMQYFKLRLREPDDTEERVAYAEGVDDEKAALELVGTRRLDHAVAAAFFGDRKRLQRDLLGDSAAALLSEQPFEPIE